MSVTPRSVQSTVDAITIGWSDGHASQYSPRGVRLACRCAACVDEITHESLIQTNRIPMTIKPKAIEVMGNYALHIEWSDGHATGIYTYDYLREICECATCRKPREFDV